MGKIITGGEANDLAGSNIFSPAARCPMYSELISNGFSVEGTYAQNQLVQQVNVAAGLGLETITVTYSWNLNTRKLQGDGEGIWPMLYYFQIAANNAEDEDLEIGGPIRVTPNISQYEGSSSGTVTLKINSNTQAIVGTIWCEYPRGWGGGPDGMGQFWTEYNAIIGGSGTSSAGTFYNQVSLMAPRTSWTFGYDYIPDGRFQFSITSCYSAQTYGTAFKREINKILNEGDNKK